MFLMFLIHQLLCSWNRILLKIFYMLLNELPSNHRNVLSMCTIEKNTKSEFLINIFFHIYISRFYPEWATGRVRLIPFFWKKIIWNHPKLYKKYLNWNWWKVEWKKGLSWVNGDFAKLLCDFYEVVWISRLKNFFIEKTNHEQKVYWSVNQDVQKSWKENPQS